MSTTDNNAQQLQQGKATTTTAVVDVRGGGGGSESQQQQQIQSNQKSDEHILLTQQHQQQQQQQPYYHHQIHQGAAATHHPQQYTMYPSGVTYSIDPNHHQAAANIGGAAIDYAVMPAQQIYQYPVYYSNTFPTDQQQHPAAFEDPYNSATAYATAATAPTGANASSSQYHQHIHQQTATHHPQYSSGILGGDQQHQQQQNYMHLVDNSQGYQNTNNKKIPNLSMFDNAAANYTADWVKRTTLLPPEAKVPPELPADEAAIIDSRILTTPKNWGEGNYLIATTQSKPTTTTAIQHHQQDALDQQLAQMNITAYSIISPQLEHQQQNPQQQQQIAGYAYNWPGTSQQQPQQQHQNYRDQGPRAYSATTNNKFQSGTFADMVKKSGNNANRGPQQSQHQHQNQQQISGGGGGGGGYQDQRGTQSAQPISQPQSQPQIQQIRYEKTFAGPKNTFNQVGNNGGNFVRNANNRSSGGNYGGGGTNNRNNNNNMTRLNNYNSNNNRSSGGGGPRQNNFQQQQATQQFSGANQQQHRGPIPSLLAQQRNQNFPRSNNHFGGQNQQNFRPQGGGGGNNVRYAGNQAVQPLMAEYNPGVPPPALPNQFRPPAMPPHMMAPPAFAPPPPLQTLPPFNMLNPQQQQYFRAAFMTQIRPNDAAAAAAAMMGPPGPYGFDQFGQRFFNPGFPFGPGPTQPYQRFNNFRNPGGFRGGPRRPRGSGGQRFQGGGHPRFNNNDSKNFAAPSERQQQGEQSKENPSSDDGNEAPLDDEMAESVNRGAEFDRDETKTPEPKGDNNDEEENSETATKNESAEIKSKSPESKASSTSTPSPKSKAAVEN